MTRELPTTQHGLGPDASVAAELGAGRLAPRCAEFSRVNELDQRWRSADDMTAKRMDNVGIVVESLRTLIPFFLELGLRLEGRATIEGEWAGRVTGLSAQRVEIAMLVNPDGHSRIELSRFLAPPVVADHLLAAVIAITCSTS